MTPVSPNRQNTINNYYNTSSHRIHTYNSLQRNLTKKESYISWTLWFFLVPTTLWSPQCTENQHTLTTICTGNSNHFITSKTVFSIHWYLGQRSSASINTHYNRKWDTSEKPYLHATFYHGPLTVYTPNLTTNTTTIIHKQPLRTNKTTSTTKDTTTITSPSLSPTQTNLVKGSRRPATV